MKPNSKNLQIFKNVTFTEVLGITSLFSYDRNDINTLNGRYWFSHQHLLINLIKVLFVK